MWSCRIGALPGVLVGLVFGLLVVLADRLLKGVSLRAFSSATLGLLLGLLFANLLIASDILRYQSETTQWALRLIVYCTFGYLGMMLAMRSNRDEFSLIIPYVRFARETTQHEPLVIDTNVIIDGRIADLCASGFLSRSLIVPRFILGELQTLADSRDPLKRERGRRGLEILNQLQSSREVELTIHDTIGDGDLETDARLVRTAKLLQARLLTNDVALGQVARLQQVQALSLVDLARALRPVVVAGDELELHLGQRRPRRASGRGLFAGRHDDRRQSCASASRQRQDGRGLERVANRCRPAHLRRIEG